MNIAARAGRWSATHWKAATFGWLAFVVVAVIAGNAIGSVKLTRSEQDTEAASALLRFLISPEAAPVITKAGLAPATGQ